MNYSVGSRRTHFARHFIEVVQKNLKRKFEELLTQRGRYLLRKTEKIIHPCKQHNRRLEILWDSGCRWWISILLLSSRPLRRILQLRGVSFLYTDVSSSKWQLPLSRKQFQPLKVHHASQELQMAKGRKRWGLNSLRYCIGIYVEFSHPQIPLTRQRNSYVRFQIFLVFHPLGS